MLDLFAGSGALGIEALSRGAAAAVFVERAPGRRGDPGQPRGARDRGRRCAGWTARAALRTASAAGDAYDLVFLDPPYRRAAGLGQELSEALPAVLAPGARVVSESDRREPAGSSPSPLTDERRYGDTLIRIHDT